ncbi:hypothetical protein [Halobacillus sp. BBL2006]|uniref:hypothetical protein n=1 Tax=Halobacillus sp. BBL2006 TaxID=1543706 RepID=UPI00054371C6|nr:hypothetical protein [Halobacillus sp. BBL2006]KHE66874.1 hypothetical protein LD39_20455 [Halobacillus sp. BBL2006]
MKINFTKKQFRTLIELIYLGEWTANSSREVDRVEKYEELMEYIYSYADKFGFDDLVVHDKKLNGHYPTREFEEEMENYIDENDEEVFWHQLVTRLAMRDAKNEGTLHPDQESLITRGFELENEYEEEFETHGLARLKIQKD